MNDNTSIKTPRNLRHLITEEYSSVQEIRAARIKIKNQPGDPLAESGSFAIYKRARECREIIVAESFRELIRSMADDGVVAAQWLFKSLTLTRYTNPTPVGNYWAFREKEGLVSYCPTGRQQKFGDNGLWQRDGRQEMKPGRFVRAFLNPTISKRISDHEIGDFVSAFKAAQAAHQWVVGREAVESAYTGDAPFSSCMQDEPVDDFYNTIGVTECVTVRTRAGDLLGRALIWESTTLFDGKCAGLIDRIYGNEEVIAAIKSWAKAHGFAHKKSQSNNCWDYTLPDGSVCSPQLRWVSPFPKHVFYPYMDTFCVYGEGAFYADSPDIAEAGDIILRETNGNYEVFRDGQVQDVDGEWINEEDAIEIDGDYYHYEDQRIFRCDNCGEYRLRSDGFCAATNRCTFYLCSDCCTPLE